MNPSWVYERPASSLSGTKKQGYLFKEGGSSMGRTWHKRWFILDDEYLYYFLDDGARKPKGVLYLKEYSDVEAVEDSPRKNTFRVYSSNQDRRVLLCSAPRPCDRESWIEAIGENLKRIHDAKTKYSTLIDERLESSVYIKVSDCRFTDKEGVPRDTYVTIMEDDIQKARTPTIYASEKPVFLHEYEFPVIPSVEVIKVEVKNQRKKKDNTIGQCCLFVDELRGQQVCDGWYKLSHVSRQTTGEVVFRTTITITITMSPPGCQNNTDKSWTRLLLHGKHIGKPHMERFKC
eukprot:TRINITY_DN10272_c0_g2_i15.p1 TRINITY_DN10272_c0_g2~~TRINITY_DN10272_c0_g2_i15.p1  ORF type:complete len:290 (-),score=42.89 TRINITY_DN10272_c0_g2_i15:44-913(-)